MKFGGTSIEDASTIKRVVQIVSSHLDQKPVLVFSAMGKTTRHLLAVAQLAADGVVREAVAKLNEIVRNHFKVARTLIPNFEPSDTKTKLEEYFEELQEWIDSLSHLSELPLCKQDKILSSGELMATAIMASVFREHGIDAELLDARNLIITDEKFSRAKPLEETTYRRIREVIQPLLESNRLPIMQGFIGSTSEGKTTTLGFEGSDYTATLVGAALDAEDIQIWTDVSGIMTADPSVVRGTRTVKTFTYEEAAELSFFGAKVLHPSTIEPARRKEIPVHIFNTKRPHDTGTLITSSSNHGTNLVKSIASTQPLDILCIQEHQKASSYGFLKSVFDILDRECIIPVGIKTEKSSLSLAVRSSEITKGLVDDLNKLGKVSITRGKASVSLVGENLRPARDFAATVFQNLNGIHVDMVAETASPINFTFVVDEVDVRSVITRLHSSFFKKLDPEVFQ